ncbi:tyrosine-type recombinase/integrase [Methylomonas sp. YC3]
MTIHHRNKHDSINTIRSVIGVLGFFATLCDLLEIDIEARFRKGKLLTKPEIESIGLWATKPIEALFENKNAGKNNNVIPINLKRLELARHTIIIDENLVEPNTTYNRLTVISKYLEWLANTFDLATEKEIERMVNRIISHRPVKVSFEDNVNFKSLDENQKKKLMELVELDSPNNPWQGEDIRFRNKLIVHVFYYVGCRKGELLSLKATDLDPGTKQISIRRDADNPNDPRTNPPLVKTKSRDIDIIDEIYLMLEDYVIKYRSKVKGANKCPYLFLSHQRGARSAMPLSHSAIDKIFSELTNVLGFSVHAHALRHAWNDDFSSMVEPYLHSGEMSESEIEDLRSYLMGWKEDSGTAKTYTKRFQHKKAMKIGLQLQRRIIGVEK